ncbi:MAG TPA: SDR family oxidoreductase [Candidatus Binatia bacterium]|jgi:NAD(P)-dependent dehydrogenase (short-subunit alcohol dehydrogenase family)
MLLKDKIALVTGSTNNIGLGIARAFAREGAKVIVHSRHGDETKKIATEIGGDHFAADLSQPEQVERLFAHIKTNHRRLDLLVNTVAHSTKNDILETTLEEWSRIMAVNVTGYFLCIQHGARMMKENGGGAIINISAASGERGSPGTAVYSISKGAINALTRQAAVDLAPYKIRVNGIISGIVGTPLGRKDMGNRKPEYESIPLRRIGQPEDVGEAAVFLASEKASYITNAILPVDGGRMNSMGSASRG